MSTKSIQEIINSITERIKATARIETVYGEPRVIDDKTIIPVAKVSYGFGAGGGEGPEAAEPGQEAQAQKGGFGGGGGAGVSAEPVGFLVISGDQVRFMPVRDRRRVLIAAMAGLFVGLILAKKLLRPSPVKSE